MEELLIRLNTIDAVRRFAGIVTAFDGDVLLKSGRYVVDGKSILGIFSLDLSKPLIVSIWNFTPEKREQISSFIVDGDAL